MSALVMFTVVALVGLASLLCNSGAWLWMAAKWCRIPNVSYLRALGSISLVATIDLLVRLVGFGLADRSEINTGVLLFGHIVLMAVAGTLCIKWILRTTTGRAVGAGVITVIVSSVVAAPLLIALRHFVMESFVVPTDRWPPR